MSVVLARPRDVDANVRHEIRIARAARRCEDYLCNQTVHAGDRYLVCTEYPGGDSGYATAARRPVRLHICLPCAPPWVQAAASTDHHSPAAYAAR